MPTVDFLGTIQMAELAAFTASWLQEEHRRLVTVMADPTRSTLHYVGHDRRAHAFAWWSVPLEGALVVLSECSRQLTWPEREAAERCGLPFSSQTPEPLINTPNASPAALRATNEPTNLQFLTYGPIRGDVLESARFEFAYAGEAILEYWPRLFYKRRDMEARFRGRPLATAAILAERVSGDDSVAHALAISEALESALGVTVPRRAQLVRVILAELERVTNHLRTWGDLAKTTTLRVADAEGHLLQERMRQLLGRATGHRFGRSVIAPGGIRRAIDADALLDDLGDLRPHILAYQQALMRTKGFYDRLAGTGVLAREDALAYGATGPVARASGLDADLRVDAPYALFEETPLEVVTASTGDAWARFQVRVGEVATSLSLVEALLREYRTLHGPLTTTLPADGAGVSLAAVEATRGRLVYLVETSKGYVDYVGIAEPSFANWYVFATTVRDTNMMDYAINEASFGLSIAGADR